MGSMDGAAYQAMGVPCDSPVTAGIWQVLLQSKLIITALILWAIKGTTVGSQGVVEIRGFLRTVGHCLKPDCHHKERHASPRDVECHCVITCTKRFVRA